MEKSFEPQTFESVVRPLGSHWLLQAAGTGEPYTIMLPPPNVTGTLHMGHAFQHTLQDALVRYHNVAETVFTYAAPALKFGRGAWPRSVTTSCPTALVGYSW